MVKVLFVCLGNICRSPTAHAVFQKKLEQAGLTNQVQVDSAGTAGWHVGKKPDARSIEAAEARGFPMSHLRARQFKPDDYHQFDYILAMDHSNLNDISIHQPADWKGHLSLFLDFCQYPGYQEVPDPYYGGEEGFNIVLDLVESAAEGLLSEISAAGRF